VEAPAEARGRRRWSLLALGCVALAYASLVQGAGSNQTGTYALVKSLAQGTAIADRTRFEVGDAGTMDISWYHGHYYIAKAPGLAAASVPPYLMLRKLGMRTSGDPSTMLWALGLWSVVLPALVLLLLVHALADQLEPGLGTAAAVILGLATLLLPFATMLFVHSLSTALTFAAFALLWRERRRGSSWASIVAAGFLAGLAVTVEYPLALVGVVLGGVAAATSPHIRRAGVFFGAFAVAASPALLYNRWAFGSATHFPYDDVVEVAGRSGHDMLLHYGAYSVSTPSFRGTMQLLFAEWGFVVTTPVLVAAAIGVALMYRRGLRVEALAIAAVAALVPIYASGVIRPYGDVAPGPRYLIPVLPFLCLGLVVALRAWPLVTMALAGGSALLWVGVTATRPMQAWNGHVVDRLTSHDLAGYSPTISELAGFSGPYRVAPFFLAVAAAVVCAVLATPMRLTRAGLPAALAAVAAWLLVVHAAPRFDQFATNAAALRAAAIPVVGVAAAAAVAILAGSARQPRR
jgi:hypothetical protein